MFDGVRKFIERGRKGYCYSDLWNFDNWLSSLIARGLREFRQNCHGYPNDIDDWEEWMAILDEMIECFEEQGRDIVSNRSGNYIQHYKDREAIKKQKLHRGLELLEKHFYDLWN